MADPKPKPKNDDIIEALKLLGVDPVELERLDTTGAQSTTFKERVTNAVLATGADEKKAAELWDQSFKLASYQRTGDPEKDLRAFLGFAGYTKETANDAVKAAKRTGDWEGAVKDTIGTTFPSVSTLALTAVKKEGKGMTLGDYARSIIEPSKPYVQFRQGERDSLNAPQVAAKTAADAQTAKTAADKAAATSRGTGDTLTGIPTPKSPQEIDDYIHAHFGADAWWMDIPEVKSILVDMAKNQPVGMDAAGVAEYAKEAVRRVSQTDWYHNTDEKSRLWHGLQNSDPAEAQTRVRKQTGTFQRMATKMGINIAPDRLSALAESSLKFDWTPEDIQSALGAEFKYDPTNQTQNTTVSAMRQKASQYLVPLSAQAIEQWTSGLLSGTYTEADYDQYLKDMAKSMFPQLSAAIDSGKSVAQWLDPYKQIASNNLDLPAESIDFADPKWKTALEQVDPKTGEKSVMTLTDWERKLKSDPVYGYDKTKAGIADASHMATEIMKKFGVSA